MALGFCLHQSFFANLANNEPAGNLFKAFSKNSGAHIPLFYGLLPAAVLVFASAPDTQVRRYTEKNLQQTTRIALNFFVQSQNQV